MNLWKAASRTLSVIQTESQLLAMAFRGDELARLARRMGGIAATIRAMEGRWCHSRGHIIIIWLRAVPIKLRREVFEVSSRSFRGLRERGSFQVGVAVRGSPTVANAG